MPYDDERLILNISTSQLFSRGGQEEAKRLKIPVLAEVPIDPLTCEAGDYGTPIALADPNKSPSSEAFLRAANLLMEEVS